MTWKEASLILGFLVFWFVLNRWVLPLFGISTCMSGSCGLPSTPPAHHHTQQLEQPYEDETKTTLPGDQSPSR